MKNFNELPASVQDEVKTTLKTYPECYAIYENGRYSVSPGIALKKTYAPDHEMIGHYLACEVFTTEEQIINYVESFHEFPSIYKGERDYGMLRRLGWSSKVGIDRNGNLYISVAQY